MIGLEELRRLHDLRRLEELGGVIGGAGDPLYEELARLEELETAAIEELEELRVRRRSDRREA